MIPRFSGTNSSILGLETIIVPGWGRGIEISECHPPVPRIPTPRSTNPGNLQSQTCFTLQSQTYFTLHLPSHFLPTPPAFLKMPTVRVGPEPCNPLISPHDGILSMFGFSTAQPPHFTAHAPCNNRRLVNWATVVCQKEGISTH